MNKDRQGLIVVESKNAVTRIALVFAILLSLVFIWFSVSWQIGHMLADFTEPTEPNAANIAGLAAWMSPRDPLAKWLKAVLSQEKSNDETRGFEDVVRLSPNDYRWWGQLGRSYEQADKTKQAESAFRYSASLAPNYVLPQWQLGNFYLRQGNENEAIEALKKAAAREPSYRDQVFSIVWEFYEQDSNKLEAIAGSSPGVIAGLAKFYAAKGMPLKSFEMWKRLSKKDQNQEANRKIAMLVAQALYEKGFLMTSIQFVSDLGLEKGVRAGAFHNGGFETEILQSEIVYFSWKMVPDDKVKVRLDSFKKHTGKRSLQVAFNGFEKSQLFNTYQTIAVKPGQQYRVSFWVKTESLSSRGMPILEVTNAIDSRALAKSSQFPAGTNDWQQISFEFQTPADSEGISVRTAREYCGEQCPLSGTLWYDDFMLEEIR